MGLRKLDLDEVREFIEQQSLKTKIYLGCDSELVLEEGGIWYAYYATAIVIHMNGNRGCKLFGEVVRERDFGQQQNKPKHRLMTETFKVSELYLKLSDILVDREVEVHLDLNPDENSGSYCALKEAIGYIQGTCNVIPMVKPNSFAASCAADRLRSLSV